MTKFLTLGEGFTSYSSATSGVPKEFALASTTDGKMAKDPATPVAASVASDAATDDLIDVLLSAEGNYVQELLLEEAAKLADAAVRDSLAQVGASGPVSVLKDVLRAPKQIAESTIGRLELPGPVKSAVDVALLPATVMDDISRLMPTLARADKSDEETLQAFGNVWEKLNGRLQGTVPAPSGAVSAEGNVIGDVQRTIETAQTRVGPLLEQLADSESRLRQRLPLVGPISSRFWAALLRRVADRLESDANRPDANNGLAREVAPRAAEGYRSLAAFIEAQRPSEVEEPNPEPKPAVRNAVGAAKV
jgi:hypothetical protein